MFTESNYKLVVPLGEIGIYMKIFEKLIVFFMCMKKNSPFTTAINPKESGKKSHLF